MDTMPLDIDFLDADAGFADGPADKQPRNLAWINPAKAKNEIHGPFLKGVLLIYLYMWR